MNKREQARCHYLDITALPPLSKAQEDMPQQRRQSLRAFVRHIDKLRCIAGWVLLSTVLGPKARQIRYARYGKPFLAGGPYFSLSHSGRYAILATASMPVGADVEEIRQADNYTDLAAQALHPHEQVFLRSRPAAQTFFDIWTLKESYLKLKGTGLNENPAAFALNMGCGEPHIDGRPDINFRLYKQLQGYSVAVCLYRCLPPETITALTLNNI